MKRLSLRKQLACGLCITALVFSAGCSGAQVNPSASDNTVTAEKSILQSIPEADSEIDSSAVTETDPSLNSEAEASASGTVDTAEASAASSDQTDKGTTYDTSTEYSSVVLEDAQEITGGTYTAEGDDESVLEASGSTVASVTGAVLNKASGSASSADASSFTGLNAAVRVYGNATVTLNKCDILAAAPNATGVFAYENGVVCMNDCTVTVTGGGAGGVQVAGGGTLYGSNLTVTSASKAAIRSDRGGGTMVLDGGTYTSTGSNGCPAIYSTADIIVKNAECISEQSIAVIIEGKNSVTLENCTLYVNGVLYG